MASVIEAKIRSFNAKAVFKALKDSSSSSGSEGAEAAKWRLENLCQQTKEAKDAIRVLNYRLLKQGLEGELRTPTVIIVNRLRELYEALVDKQRHSKSIYLEERMCSLRHLNTEIKYQLDVIQNIMIGPNTNEGIDLSNICRLGHDAIYARMFQPGNIGSYNMCHYLRDFDSQLAIVFHYFRAAMLILTAGARDAHDAQQSKADVECRVQAIKTHAYACFSGTVRALKWTHDDTERRTHWWRLETLTTTPCSESSASITDRGVLQKCSAEGVMISYTNMNRDTPEVAWTFDPACHPLDGLCTLISRCQANDIAVKEVPNTSMDFDSHVADGTIKFWDRKTLSNTIWTLRDDGIE